jgi:hypothetical protein
MSCHYVPLSVFDKIKYSKILVSTLGEANVWRTAFIMLSFGRLMVVTGGRKWACCGAERFFEWRRFWLHLLGAGGDNWK